jgi:hypothetical protein
VSQPLAASLREHLHSTSEYLPGYGIPLLYLLDKKWPGENASVLVIFLVLAVNSR